MISLDQRTPYLRLIAQMTGLARRSIVEMAETALFAFAPAPKKIENGERPRLESGIFEKLGRIEVCDHGQRIGVGVDAVIDNSKKLIGL